MTVAIYTVVRFRARAGDQRDGEPIHGNARLEVAWVTIPSLIVTALAVYAWITLDDIEARQPDAMTIKVVARQFAWSYEYERPGTEEPIATHGLVLPVAQPVEFRITRRGPRRGQGIVRRLARPAGAGFPRPCGPRRSERRLSRLGRSAVGPSATG